jgi:hypothetical protein
MLKFDHGYVTCLYVPFILLAMRVLNMWLSCLFYVSFLASCSVLCLFEKYTLSFVDLIHALSTRGRNVPNLGLRGRSVHLFQFCIELEGYSVQGENLSFYTHLFVGGACIHAWGDLCRLTCALCFTLLPMVSSPFSSP